VGVTGEKRIILFDLLDFSPLALVKQRHSVIELARFLAVGVGKTEAFCD
jgi:hypothetical protein